MSSSLTCIWNKLKFSSICLDTEKPKVLTCPTDMTKISKTERMRVSWEVPAFKDNYDPYPKIRSTRSTGSYFYYGKLKLFIQLLMVLETKPLVNSMSLLKV